MDGLGTKNTIVPGTYLLAPIDGQNIKMDAFQAIIYPIPTSYIPAKDDIIAKLAAFAYDYLKN